MIVTPAEVCKIRMQSQYNSLMDPSQIARRKYTNVAQTAVVIVKEEGISTLYKGVVPTMIHQGCNQAVNFTIYNMFKKKLLELQNMIKELLPWQNLILGAISGGFGPRNSRNRWNSGYNNWNGGGGDSNDYGGMNSWSFEEV